jgi:predicted permease
MRTALMCLFSVVLVGMLAVTTYASLQRNILDAGSAVVADRWFQATLVDAYFGFLTFYVWVAYKESKWFARVIWFVLIMLLGNIAMSVYVLIQLARLRPGEGAEQLLLRRPQAEA